MNSKHLILILLCVILTLNGCTFKTPLCVQLTGAYPINDKDIKRSTENDIDNNFYLYYDPLVLPVTLRYTAGKGISIITKNLAEMGLVTPIGVVGTGYTVNTKTSHNINGHRINGGDFIVAIINRKKEEKNLYKIEGYSRLKIVANGKTSIDAQSGYVEIDVTNTKVEEFSFVDNSKISLVNTTDKTVSFFFAVKDPSSSVGLSTCSIPPHSYKYYPNSSILNSINELASSQYFFQVQNNDEKNDYYSDEQCKVSFGDVCQIVMSDDGKKVRLQKKR